MMKRRQLLGIVGSTSAVSVLVGRADAQEAEKLFASDVVVRTILAFKVPDDAVQKTLAAGWEINPPKTGPDQGANLIIYVTDFQMIQDAQGKPIPTRPSVALIVPARKGGSDLAAFMVTGGFTGQANTPGPYGNFIPARVNVDRRLQTDGDGRTTVTETWEMKAEDGTALALRVQFTRAAPTREKVAWQYYSAAKPDFHRTYRIEHGYDVVRSVPSGVDRASEFSFEAGGPKLAPFFNGTERLISITSIPYYSRSILLPA
jgi:hypothetical protein